MKVRKARKVMSSSLAALEAPQLLATAQRGMRANADFMNLLRDQAIAHRRAASASTLPRVRAHLSALAESLEAMLEVEDGSRREKNKDHKPA